jgi:hypothetical protein
MPENFIYTNPQFGSATWRGNMLHMNYHSIQVQASLRPVQGFSFTGTYVFSRNLGDSGSFTDPRNIRADYGILGQHRAHTFVSYGSFELPIGPNRLLLRNSSGILGRVAGGWQLSWIANFSTGRPTTLSTSRSYFGFWNYSSGPYTTGIADYVGPQGAFDPRSGKANWPRGAYSTNYYNNKYVYVKDPQCNVVASELRNLCNLTAVALASDPSVILFQNSKPGSRGNYGMNNVFGPGSWSLDMAASKSIKVAEGKSIQFRVDTTNVLNHPSTGSPSLTINADRTSANPYLGYISSKSGRRTFQAKLRFDF